MPTLDWLNREDAAHEFRFDPACYPVPANRRYQGRFRFSKHDCPVLADLEDGSEEWRCALAIDEHPQVRHWVRNLDSDPMAGFRLPTSFGRLRLTHFSLRRSSRPRPPPVRA